MAETENKYAGVIAALRRKADLPFSRDRAQITESVVEAISRTYLGNNEWEVVNKIVGYELHRGFGNPPPDHADAKAK